MRTPCILVVALVVAAGCRSRPSCSNLSDGDVPLVRSHAGNSLVPQFAFSQLSAARQSVAGQTRHRVFSISGGLSDVRAISKNPIVAATDQDGWFFFATSVATDADTRQPTEFISGYAIRRGSREIIYWSTW